MTTEDIQKVILASLNAPSGDNCQPWKFVIRHNVVTIYNLPDRDLTLYNHNQYGSYLAHGALVENIHIVAAHFGLSVDATFFPNSADSECVAQLSFKEGASYDDSLFDAISQRATNRKPYTNNTLPVSVREAIHSSAAEIGAGVETRICEDITLRQQLAAALSVNERILLENKSLHDVFFSHIRWTESEEKAARTGLYAKTMELLPPQLAVFKACKNWAVLSVLNKLGLSKFIAKENAKTYASGMAFGVVLIPSETKENFAIAGRVVERIWLKMIKAGLYMQPVTAIPYLALRARAHVQNEFSPEQEIMVEDANTKVRTIFQLSSQTIAMVFRVGEADKPSATSSRLSPTVTIESRL